MTAKYNEVILIALAEKISRLESDNKLKDYQIESLKKKVEELEKYLEAEKQLIPTTKKIEIR